MKNPVPHSYRNILNQPAYLIPFTAHSRKAPAEEQFRSIIAKVHPNSPKVSEL
jgi:hypothetical protein